MKTHDHAAQLAGALIEMTAMHEIRLAAMRPDQKPNPGSAAENAHTQALAALAAWDKHNAPAPQQNALDLTGE